MFIPPKSKDPLFNSIITQLKSLAENLNNVPINKVNNNVTIQEREAIKKLAINDDIVIKKADKGGSIIIMNKDYYINKVNECLSNSEVYKKLPKNLDNKVMNNIKNLTNKYKLCFDKKGKEIKYITDFNFKMANFYGLPKIHKSKMLIQEIKQCNDNYIKIKEEIDLPFRFITGGPISPTSKLSELLDILLKPFYSKIPSYIRDSTDYLNKLPTLTPEEVSDSLIITCDVENMYSNITLNLGLKAITYWVYKHPELLNPRFSVEFILEALKLVLTNSNFQFNNEYYTLVRGTVTGTIVAPTYANLIMAYLEVELYKRIKDKFGEKVYNYCIKNWHRFLDDGTIIWRKSFGNIEGFIEILKSLDSNIKFTYESSEVGLPFLNVYLYVENNVLLTDVYYKETDSHYYLPFDSCHPRHTKISIPENLVRIICTIVDDPNRKELRLIELKNWLKEGGYPLKLIENAILKISKIDKKDLREKVVKKNNEVLVFVKTFNPKNPNVFGQLMKCISFLSTIEEYKKIFENINIIKSERQSKNLGQILQKSEINRTKLVNGSKCCDKKSCGTCKYLLETDVIKFERVNVNFKLFGSFSCDSGNVIYKI
ncbi:MAG: hypothetical protein HRT42_14805, partial [Campylobacteraceae bacterium]|nr:hypothetical protein [Campylobacteraceae bacterium]